MRPAQKGKLEKLRRRHDAFIERIKAAGRPVLPYTTPCCQTALETSAPSNSQRWDSLCTCPGCGRLYIKWVSRTEVQVAVPLQEG